MSGQEADLRRRRRNGRVKNVCDLWDQRKRRSSSRSFHGTHSVLNNSFIKNKNVKSNTRSSRSKAAEKKPKYKTKEKNPKKFRQK
jgi:hypothetical protein